MKRWLFLILAAVPLCGCAPEEAPPTDPTVHTVEVSPTDPTGYYDPENQLEATTGGAVRAFPLNRSDSYGLAPMGEDLLLFSGLDRTTLTRLSGYHLYEAATAQLERSIHPDDPDVQVSSKGVTYYDHTTHQLVFLDGTLKEVNRVDLPEDILGLPALTADRTTLFYLTANALRAIDLETGLDKLLKEMFFPTQELVALQCDDTIVECFTEDNYGNRYGLFISAQTGETLYETFADVTVYTHADAYLALHSDGGYVEYLTGSADSGPTALTPEDFYATAEPLLSMGSVLMVSVPEDAAVTTLNLYNLGAGKRTHKLELPGIGHVWSLQEDAQRELLWFIYYDALQGCDTLCRWEMKRSAISDETSYFSVRRSLSNPDTEGLARCKETALALSEKYNVEILLWNDATAYQPWDYLLEAEYQVPLIEHNLKIIDEALSRYPEGFLKTTAAYTTSKKLRICLVRSIGTLSADVFADKNGLQYWDDNGDAYLALCATMSPEYALHHELFHAIESRVMSRSSAYDQWEELNPDGFTYDLDYAANQKRDGSQWLTGENRAFIDTYSMSFPKEDRARIMEYAITEGNESYFQSEIMQNKLYQLCFGIRKAFKLMEEETIFPWEQYLKTPLNRQ